MPRYEDGAEIDGLAAYPLRDFEEKPVSARARELFESGGVAWNAGMFLWRRRAIRAALEKYTSLAMMLGQGLRVGDRAQGGLRPDPAALDRLRGDGGRGPRPAAS